MSQTCQFCGAESVKKIHVKQYFQNQEIQICEKCYFKPVCYGECQCIICGMDINSNNNNCLFNSDKKIYFMCSYICKKELECRRREKHIMKNKYLIK